MKSLKEILKIFQNSPAKDVREIVERLPGKDCGLCGFKTCAEFAERVAERPDEIGRCIYLGKSGVFTDLKGLKEKDSAWKDMLGREYDFILDKFPDDPGPRETIALFNPLNVERLKIKKDDILFGRPAWAGCPVTHCGIVLEEPDYFNGVIVWAIVGPIPAREKGINIGYYNPIAYEGLVIHTRVDLQFGMRYYFLPRYCMLQSRHSGVLNLLVKTKEGVHARLEGIML